MQVQIFFGVVALAVFFVLPHSTQAYFTTNQTATQISDNAALFTVSYEFGHGDRNLYLPATIKRDETVTDDSGYLGYQLVDEAGEVIALGESYGMVASEAVLGEVSYSTPVGELTDFTAVFLVIFTDEELAELAGEDVALQISALPFVMKNDEVTVTTELNATELRSYQTPYVKF